MHTVISTRDAGSGEKRDGTRTPLRIAQVAPLWMRVPPPTYGGTELMVHLLIEELVRCGHAVTLFASGDSRTRAALHPVVPRGLIELMGDDEAGEYEHYANHAFAEAIRRANRFDVIHSHLGCSRIPMGVAATAPVLHTLHAPPSIDDLWVLERYPDVPVAAISHYQASTIRPQRDVEVVHHGIEFAAYEPSLAPGQYLAFLGRMGPQKSPVEAIRIAKAVGLPLVLAGKPQNAPEEVYFTEQVRPHIDGEAVRYIGAVAHAEKVDLLRNAAVLLFPIQGEEAFGLAMVEAMACGTPVVGCARASVREVVDAGITGFHAESVDDLPGLVVRAQALDRAAVRQHALSRFSHRTMAGNYMALYASLARQGRS
jgi:glycosyltransferase involved in cell wall biosynthesis